MITGLLMNGLNHKEAALLVGQKVPFRSKSIVYGKRHFFILYVLDWINLKHFFKVKLISIPKE